jgi:hypothetical protein
MNLYEFTLEIQEGASSYTQKEFVLAKDDLMASRFAREFAQHWRPRARYDETLDVYIAPDGWPQWVLARCAPVAHLSVPIAGRSSATHARVALVPEVTSNL